MGWAPAFIADLGRTSQCAYTVRKMPTFTILPGVPGTVARSDQSSVGLVALSPGAPLALSSQSLSIPSFAVGQTQWRIALSGIEAGQWATTALPRGAACEVFRQTSAVSVAERIILGQSRDVAGIGPQSIVSGWGPLALVISRPEARVSPSSSDTNDAALFANCQATGNALALSAPFAFGTHTTLQFASAPPMQRETGRPGAVLITPSSGDPYIVTFTGVSGNDLTGVSTTAEHGTSGSNASAGDIVQEVCWINRHPVDMARRVLVSTGTGTNGPHDTLPESWGLGIPAHLIDAAGFLDTSNALNSTISSGSYIVNAVATTPQGPALQWLQTELNRYGLWLCTRQGQITIRAALDYWRHGPSFVMALTDDNIISAALPERSNYDGGNSAEAVFYTVKGEVLSDWFILTESPKTRPLIATIANGPIVDGWPSVYQNQALINESIARRVGPWHLRIAIVVEVQATLSAARLCVGDWVSITHRGLWDHTSTVPRGTLRAAMVTAMSCDWSAGVVALRLHILPESTDA